MDRTMNEKLYIGVETVMNDFDISKPKAYAIIHTLNEELRKSHPSAIVVAGKVNKYWYDEACLRGNVSDQQV